MQTNVQKYNEVFEVGQLATPYKSFRITNLCLGGIIPSRIFCTTVGLSALDLQHKTPSFVTRSMFPTSKEFSLDDYS